MFPDWYIIDFNDPFTPEEMEKFAKSPIKHFLIFDLKPDNLIPWAEKDYESYLQWAENKILWKGKCGLRTNNLTN